MGSSDWLVIEADESGGSIVQYHPAIGLLLNIEKDYKELDELIQVFETFQKNSAAFIVNQSNEHAQKLSVQPQYDFNSSGNAAVGFDATDFKQEGFSISFKVNEQPFALNVAGRRNMENAVAAVVAANMVGVSLQTASEALTAYEGIYRR